MATLPKQQVNFTKTTVAGLEHQADGTPPLEHLDKHHAT